MKSYLFNASIEKEPVEKLIEFLNENPGSRVYFNSDGGDVYLVEPLIEIIEENCGELIATGEISSCALKIFFKSEVRKRIIPGTTGIYHSVGQRFRMTIFGKPSEECNDFYFKELMKDKDQEIDFCLWIGMNDKEIDLFQQSKDVYFNYQRLNELLRKSNKPLQSL